MGKWLKKDYFIAALDIFEQLLDEQPDFSDYLPDLINWCGIEIRRIDSQKEMQRIKRQTTNINRKNPELYAIIKDALDDKYRRPSEIHEKIKNKIECTPEQIRYRLQQMQKDGEAARIQVKSLKSDNQVWAYKRVKGGDT